ncbi:hypothetical protein ANN_27802 [Periplaneta americana]|uniref:Tc1-like transposase DDE domain-containing protein n=1 Tax=Periplaneta americana TaxID=6978 RepID=A0ABQ8RV78_PERAM|nr:hypothetical protein ANN_27802 [Periplaneta americana]
MRKCDLIELIDTHKPVEKLFRVDQLMKQHVHSVLRLPPYMCDLNCIELAYAKIKHYVREHKPAGDLSLRTLQETT